MNNTDNKKFKKGLLIILIIAAVLIGAIILFVVIKNNSNGGSPKPKEEVVNKKEENKEEEKDTDYTTLLNIVDSLRLYLGIGSEYENLRDVPNANIAYFIQGVTNIEGYKYGYTFNKNEYLTYCMPNENCSGDAIITDDVSYTSAIGGNNAYLFDKVKKYAKTTFKRDISLDDIKGNFIRAYKKDNKDYIIDTNGGFTGLIIIQSVESIKEDNNTVEALINVASANNKYEKVLFVFKLLNNSTLDDLKLENIEILTYEMK